MSISLSGTWIQQVAMGWLVYRMTNSLVLLATSVFMAQIPNLLVTPFCSVLIDRINRRKLLILTQSLSAFQALALSVLTLTNTIEIWHIFVLSLFLGCANSLDIPTRQAFYPSLVSPSKLGNAIALNSTVINGAKLIGPAIGGVVIAICGEGVCFLINGLSYLGVIIPLLMMKNVPNTIVKKKVNVIGDLVDGFQYVRHHVPIRNLLFLMSATSFFGLPLMTYIPAYVRDTLMGDSVMQSWLFGGIGLGAVMASLMLAMRKSVLGLGHFAAFSGVVMGAGLLLISQVSSPMMAAALCVPIGFGVIANVAAINTLLQTLSVEDKRGRVMGYLSMTFNGLAPVSGLCLSSFENEIGLSGILFVCGVGCVLSSAAFVTRTAKLIRFARPIYEEKRVINAKTLASEIRF